MASRNPFGEIGRFVDRLSQFWHSITEGRELGELWHRFHAEARSSYSLYARDVDWTAFENQRGFRRRLMMARSLFWALLMKLSPPRRIFLLIALVLTLFALAAPGNDPLAGRVYTLLATGSLLALIALELADRLVMKRDLEIARDIQSWLLPSKPPEVPGFDIAFATRPANTVSGDFYDAFLRDVAGHATRRLQIVVADVAGKSVPAALLMATFQASLRTLAEALPDLSGLVTGLNRYACEHSLGGRRFTTAFLADIDPATGAFTYINAGHNSPLLRRADGSIERLEAGGLPFGIQAGGAYDTGLGTLAPGDLLIVYTDGVVEAENVAGEQFDDARLLAFCKEAPPLPASTILAALMNTVDRFVAGAPQHDDLTALIVRRTQ